MIELLTHKEVKIRKAHKCHGCCRTFDPGTAMIYWSCVEDRIISSGYNCKTCEGIMIMSDQSDYADGFPQGFVLEILPYGDIKTPEQLLEYMNQRILQREKLNY